jgi:hypothetical protein
MTERGEATPGVAARAPDGHTIEVERQNAYLKLRCAQLQDDVTDLSAQVIRLQQDLERLRGRRANPLESSRP